jgi:hypothetical protein
VLVVTILEPGSGGEFSMTVMERAPAGSAAPTKPSRVAVVLSALAAVPACAAAATGLVWSGGGPHVPVQTVRGDPATLDGRGLYRFDTVFAAAGQRGTDVVVLLVVVPLLAWAVWRYRRGRPSAVLVWAGALLALLYVYAGPALGTVAYNNMFLVYVAVLSASLSAFVLLFASRPMRGLEAGLAAGMPRRPLAYFLIASGVVVLISCGAPPWSPPCSATPRRNGWTHTARR